MNKELFRKLISPFWITLILGLGSLALLLQDLGRLYVEYIHHLIAGIFVGLLLGVIVIAFERYFYIHHNEHMADKSRYKTTPLPKYILLCLITVLMLVSREESTGFSVVIVMTISIYLITLSIVIYQVSRNNKIMLT